MNGPANGMVASMRAELLRLRKWPAVWVTLSAWMALTAMFGYLSYSTGDTSFSNEGATAASLLQEILPGNVPTVLVQGMPMFGGALMMVLGAIVAGNGYGWGPWKTVLTQGPARISAVLGSLTALTAFVALTVSRHWFSASVSRCWLRPSSRRQSSGLRPRTSPSRSAPAPSLVMQMWALAGFALGTVARGPALSVGLGLVWALVIENLLRGVGALLGPVEAFTKILPGTSAGSLVGSTVGVGGPNPTHPRRSRCADRRAGDRDNGGVPPGPAASRTGPGQAPRQGLRARGEDQSPSGQARLIFGFGVIVRCGGGCSTPARCPPARVARRRSAGSAPASARGVP
jgi:ABC-2 type transport system permease protein